MEQVLNCHSSTMGANKWTALFFLLTAGFRGADGAGYLIATLALWVLTRGQIFSFFLLQLSGVLMEQVLNCHSSTMGANKRTALLFLLTAAFRGADGAGT